MNHKINKMEGREEGVRRERQGRRKKGRRKEGEWEGQRTDRGRMWGSSVGKGGRVASSVCPLPALWSQPKILSQF